MQGINTHWYFPPTLARNNAIRRLGTRGVSLGSIKPLFFTSSEYALSSQNRIRHQTSMKHVHVESIKCMVIQIFVVKNSVMLVHVETRLALIPTTPLYLPIFYNKPSHNTTLNLLYTRLQTRWVHFFYSSFARIVSVRGTRLVSLSFI